MPRPTVEERLAQAERNHADAETMIQDCHRDLGLTRAIESANARDIAKLKRHVAKLQEQVRSLVEANSKALHPPKTSTPKPPARTNAGGGPASA